MPKPAKLAARDAGSESRSTTLADAIRDLVRGTVGDTRSNVRYQSSYEPAATPNDMGRADRTVRSNAIEHDSSNPAATHGDTGGRERRSSGNRARLTRVADAYGDSEDEAAGREEAGKAKEATEQRDTSSPDDFYSDFQRYSNANLDGMGLYDFASVDGSDEDREAWRAMTSDPFMRAYYEDAINGAGGFDSWYDQMTGDSLDDILSGGQGVMERHFGRDDDAVQAMFDELGYLGYIPEVGGDENQQAAIQSALAQDYQQAADLMAYNYALNMLGDAYNSGGATPEGLSLDEVSNLMSYGNMEYGYGDGYSTDVSMPEGQFEEVTRISPDDWYASIERRNTSMPGYGLADQGWARALVNALYGGAGYREQEGVPELWDYYYNGDNATSTQESR